MLYLSFLFFLGVSLHYSQIYVSPNATCSPCNGSLSSPYPDLPSAVQASKSPIILLDGTYYIQNLTISSRNLEIQSQNGASNSIIDGKGMHSCLNLISGSFVITGVTIQNCFKPNDTVTSSPSRNNSGAAIWIESSNVKLFNLNINNNSAYFAGGAVGILSGSLFLTNCTVIKNNASLGGAIYQKSAASQLANDTLIQNNSAQIGAGYYLVNGSSQVVNSTKIQNNYIQGRTGSKNQGYCEFASITFSTSTVTDSGYECHSCTVSDQNNTNICGSPDTGNNIIRLRFLWISILVILVGILL